MNLFTTVSCQILLYQGREKNLRKLQTPDMKHKPVGQEMSSSPSRKPELLSSVVAVLADQHSLDLQPMINNKNLLISTLLSLNSRKHAALRDVQMEVQSTQSTLTGMGVSLLRFILPVLQIIYFLCFTVHLHCTILRFYPSSNPLAGNKMAYYMVRVFPTHC